MLKKRYDSEGEFRARRKSITKNRKDCKGIYVLQDDIVTTIDKADIRYSESTRK